MKKGFQVILLLILTGFFIFKGLNLKIPQAQAQSFTVETYGTIHSASIRVRPIPDEVTNANLEYRKQGEIQWKQGLDPVITVANSLLEAKGDVYYSPDEDKDVVDPAKGEMIRRLHGNVMYLEPATNYEIKLQLTREDNSVYDTVSATVQTKPNEVTYGTGNTLNVPSQYSTINAALLAARAGDTILVQPGVYQESLQIIKAPWGLDPSGSPGNPTTIRGMPGAVFEFCGESINPHFINNVHDIIIEGFTFKGRSRSRISFSDTINYRSMNIARIVIQNNTFINEYTDAGDFISFRNNPDQIAENISEIIVQNNTFRATQLYQNAHAMYFTGCKGCIIRYNDLRVNGGRDIVDFRGRFYDLDIYGNYFEGSPNDDGFEMEGGALVNIRVWNNTFNAYGGNKAAISYTPVVVGPVYVFRNTFYGAAQFIKTPNDDVKNAIAAGTHFADFGPIFYYHNTYYIALDKPVVIEEHSFFRYDWYLYHMNLILKNNLIYGTKMSDRVGRALQYDRNDPYYGVFWGQLDSNYNLFWDGTTNNPNAAYGLDLNSLFTNPLFVSSTWPNPDLRLQSTSPAIDKGIHLANINDNFNGSAPDLGAYEYGQAGVTLQKSVDKTQASSGDTLTYIINYTNNGTVEAVNAVLEDPIPSNATFIAGSASNGGNSDGTKVIWNLGNLAPGARGSVQFQVRIQ